MQQSCDTASHAHDMACDTVGLRAGQAISCPRARGLAAGGESRYKFCIVAEGDLLGHDTTRDMALCTGNTARNAGVMGLDIMIQFCIATGGIGGGGGGGGVTIR